MLEIVVITKGTQNLEENKSKSFNLVNDAPIYEVFDRYNEYYHIKDLHKKCIVFETDHVEAYLYLFPSLPENKEIVDILIQNRSYNPSVSIILTKDTEITAQRFPISVYPKTFDVQMNIFDFLQCDFYLEIPIRELTINKAKYICSKLCIDIKKRKKEDSDIILHNQLEKYKNGNVNALDLSSIWEENFLPLFENEENVHNYTRLDIECNIKNSDPKQYDIIKENTNALYAFCCIHKTDYSVSSLFCEMFRLCFVCSNYDKKTIYYFRDHKWVLSDGGICIKNSISNDFPKKLFQLSSKFVELSEIVEKICFMIQNQTTRNKIFTDCCEILYHKCFMEKVNSSIKLISFSNGVYDTERGILRSGRPDDYIVLSTNIPYKIFDPQSPVMRELIDFLQKVFPVENIMKYFVRFISSCLEGGNKDKIFSIWSGLGDNGKSVLVNLISLAFGEYSVKLPTSLVSGKRSQSASATPELAMMEGVLISFLQEPDETERMNLGIVKELTGNDSLYVRGLFEKGKNISIKSKFVLIANRIPQLGTVDKAAWNRIKVIPFLSTFVDDLKKNNEKEHLYKKDVNFSQKLPYLAPALMYLLTEEYKNYKLYGLEEPDEIREYTQELRLTNDPLEQFIESDIVTSPESSESIKEIYESYKVWFKALFSTSKVMDISNFSRELKSKLKKRCIEVSDSTTQILGIKMVSYY
jgi:P4 family phage/plasmid primase-like protien